MSGIFVQMTGMSGAGKSTMTFKAADVLREMGYNVEVIESTSSDGCTFYYFIKRSQVVI